MDLHPHTPIPNGHDPGAMPAVARRGAMAALGRDPAARETLRRMVEETPRSLRQIAIEHGVPPGSLHRFVVEQGWIRPPEAPRAAPRRERPPPGDRPLAAGLGDAGAVMGRLVGAVDRQVAMIERRLAKRDAAVEEKDARILGTLAKTLATLMALERDGGAKPDRAEPPDSGEFRADLLRRIAAWAGQRTEPAGPDGGTDGSAG